MKIHELLLTKDQMESQDTTIDDIINKIEEHKKSGYILPIKFNEKIIGYLENVYP